MACSFFRFYFLVVNDFDSVARFYDALAYLVFGNSIQHVQHAHLEWIRKNDGVLILGGGTGKLLPAIPPCRKIDYVEKSNRMLRKAKSREVSNSITFIHSDFTEHAFENKYDVIICPFFLDCFSKDNLIKVLNKCQFLMNSGGSLIVSDFQKTNSNAWLLYLMQRFFRVLTNLDSHKLPDIDHHLKAHSFILKEMSVGKHGLFSGLYQVDC